MIGDCVIKAFCFSDSSLSEKVLNFAFFQDFNSRFEVCIKSAFTLDIHISCFSKSLLRSTNPSHLFSKHLIDVLGVFALV